MERGFLLDVVVREPPVILELLAGKDESLLIGAPSHLVKDLGLDVVDAGLLVDLDKEEGSVGDEELQLQGLHIGVSDEPRCIKVDADKLAETGRVVVLDGLGVSKGFQDGIRLEELLLQFQFLN